jgi:hypothetical protein
VVELFVFVAAGGAFFFVFAPGALCATAIEPVTRKALTQKLAANFKYLVIGILISVAGFDFFRPSSTPTPKPLVDTTSAPPVGRSCGPQSAVIQTKYSSLLRQI